MNRIYITITFSNLNKLFLTQLLNLLMVKNLIFIVKFIYLSSFESKVNFLTFLCFSCYLYMSRLS